MAGSPSALHQAMGFRIKPSVPQLKRYVSDLSQPIELRRIAMLEVAARTSKRIAWLRSVADSKAQSAELRVSAQQWIAMIQAYRGARSILRGLGLW